MDSLVVQLKENHLALIEYIDQVHQNIRHYPDAKPKLKQLEIALLSHFEKQKKDFYSSLKEFCALSREKFKLLEFLETDLKDLKIKLLIFSDEHPAGMGDVRPKRIVQDFEQFSQEIIGRIHHERKYLLPILEEAMRDGLRIK